MKRPSSLDALIARLPAAVEPPAGLWEQVRRPIERQLEQLDHQLDSLPRAIEPPQTLWQRVLSGVEDRSGRAGANKLLAHAPFAGLTAPFGLAALLAIVVLFANLTTRVGISTSTRADNAMLTAISNEIVWPAELLDGLTRRQDATRDEYLTRITESIRQEFETVRADRIAIERSLQRGIESSELRELWAHSYHTELMLIDQASKLTARLEQGEDI